MINEGWYFFFAHIKLYGRSIQHMGVKYLIAFLNYSSLQFQLQLLFLIMSWFLNADGVK